MNPIRVNLEIDLDKYLVAFRGYDGDGELIEQPQTLEEVVLERAASIVADRVSRDESKGLRDRVHGITQEEIRARIIPVVEAAITSPIQRTNDYGNPVGEAVPLTDEIVRLTHAYLNGQGGGYSRDRGTPVQQFIKEAVKKVVDAEFAAAVKEAKGQIAAAVHGQLAGLMQKAVMDLAGIK